MFNSLFNVFLIESVIDHDMVNVNKKKKKSHIIHYVHYSEYHDPNVFYIKKLVLFIPFLCNEDTLKGHHSTWHSAYNMHEKQISLVRKKIVYCFYNDNTHIMNWANIKSEAEELATINDTKIWMIRFLDANVHFPLKEITNYFGVKPYNINIEYVITPHIGMSTIPNSNTVDAQDQICFYPRISFIASKNE